MGNSPRLQGHLSFPANSEARPPAGSPGLANKCELRNHFLMNWSMSVERLMHAC